VRWFLNVCDFRTITVTKRNLDLLRTGNRIFIEEHGKGWVRIKEGVEERRKGYKAALRAQGGSLSLQ